MPVTASRKFIVSPATAEESWTARVTFDPTATLAGVVDPLIVNEVID